MGGALSTIKGWVWGSVFVGIAACSYWIGPNVYAIKYSVSADRVFVDPKPTDCDFWHAPLGTKECHYERIVTASYAKGGARADYRYDPKTDQLIDLRTNEKASDIRPGERDTDARFDSVLISWVKKSD